MSERAIDADGSAWISHVVEDIEIYMKYLPMALHKFIDGTDVPGPSAPLMLLRDKVGGRRLVPSLISQVRDRL